MEKRKRSQYGKVVDMSDYEKQRMSKLMLNASRMEAVGLGTLATKILSSKYDVGANRTRISKETSAEENDSEDSSDEDRGYEPTFGEDSEEELRIMQGFPLGEKVSRMSEGLSNKGEKKQLHQTSSMAEFAKLRSRKFKEIKKNPQLEKLGKRVMQESCQQYKDVDRQQYLATGTMDVYKKLKRNQPKRHCNNLSSADLSPTVVLNDAVDESLLTTPSNQDFQVSPLTSALNQDMSGTHINVLPQEALEINHDMPPSAIRKKHRGPTLMVKVHRRQFEERPIIVLNAKGQPVGPSKHALAELAAFLGTLARDPHMTPLNILDWKFMPTKENIWSYVKEKFIIPEEGKKYVLETVNENWRVYKSRLKKKHYIPYTTTEERWDKRPDMVPEKQFRDLLDYWDSPVGKEIARVNAFNRQKSEDVHTMGPTSLAFKRYELEQKDANKQPPSESMVYKESRKRDPTRVYKTDGCKTKENIEKMNGIQLEIESGDKSKNIDAFREVITKERGGRVFLEGKGVTRSSLKDKREMEGYIVDQNFFENMKAKWIKEVTPALASAIMSQLQEANPHMNLVIPDFTCTSTNSNQLTSEQVLHSDTETRPSPQDEDMEL